MAAPSIEEGFAINAPFTRYACALDHGDVDAVAAGFSESATLDSARAQCYLLIS